MESYNTVVIISLDIYHCHTFTSFLAFLYGAGASQVDLVQLSIVLTLKTASNHEEDRAEAPPRQTWHFPGLSIEQTQVGSADKLKEQVINFPLYLHIAMQ